MISSSDFNTYIRDYFRVNSTEISDSILAVIYQAAKDSMYKQIISNNEAIEQITKMAVIDPFSGLTADITTSTDDIIWLDDNAVLEEDSGVTHQLKKAKTHEVIDNNVVSQLFYDFFTKINNYQIRINKSAPASSKLYIKYISKTTIEDTQTYTDDLILAYAISEVANYLHMWGK